MLRLGYNLSLAGCVPQRRADPGPAGPGAVTDLHETSNSGGPISFAWSGVLNDPDEVFDIQYTTTGHDTNTTVTGTTFDDFGNPGEFYNITVTIKNTVTLATGTQAYLSGSIGF